jgi:hypothetical protein
MSSKNWGGSEIESVFGYLPETMALDIFLVILYAYTLYRAYFHFQSVKRNKMAISGPIDEAWQTDSPVLPILSCFTSHNTIGTAIFILLRREVHWIFQNSWIFLIGGVNVPPLREQVRQVRPTLPKNAGFSCRLYISPILLVPHRPYLLTYFARTHLLNGQYWLETDIRQIWIRSRQITEAKYCPAPWSQANT